MILNREGIENRILFFRNRIIRKFLQLMTFFCEVSRITFFLHLLAMSTFWKVWRLSPINIKRKDTKNISSLLQFHLYCYYSVHFLACHLFYERTLFFMFDFFPYKRAKTIHFIGKMCVISIYVQFSQLLILSTSKEMKCNTLEKWKIAILKISG